MYTEVHTKQTQLYHSCLWTKLFESVADLKCKNVLGLYYPQQNIVNDNVVTIALVFHVVLPFPDLEL